MKPKIQILPEELRGKIAAGEVIERPASVIKELLENAFDAGASEIKIEFSKGGLEKIVLYDNGEGMGPEDLKLCYRSFATSKIKEISDLYHLKTYGFRGEALASIAQVSRLRILSKERGKSLSFEVLVEFGKERAYKPSHLKEGTLVEVKDLFENLPARKAFLKSIKTERSKNLEIIKALMLTHPEISFFLKIDEEEILHWRGGTLKELFSYLFDIPKENLLESSTKDGPYQIDLLLTDKTLTFSHGRFLYFLVNNRWIKDEKLTKLTYYLLRKFYGNLGLPAGVIKIKLPPHLIDFNVHPAKWEVRFKREQEIYNLLEMAFTEHNKIQKSKYFPQVNVVKEDLPLSYSQGQTPKISQEIEKTPLFNEKVPSFKIIGSFLNTYILVEKDEELYIIDQHALAERIHYEELSSKSFLSLPQRLLLPLLIKLTPEMFENIEKKLEILEKLGFDLEVVGKEEILIKGVPSELEEEAKEILEKLFSLPKIELKEARDHLLKAMACKLARKKGDFLTSEEKYFLVRKMFQNSLYTCPHERPLFFKISLSEIEKKLKRKL